MLPRLAPIALVILAACDHARDAASVPSAVTPEELLRAALESPGDGSDIVEAVGCFGSAEAWRNAPAGLVVSERSIEAILEAHGSSVEVDKTAPQKNITPEALLK